MARSKAILERVKRSIFQSDFRLIIATSSLRSGARGQSRQSQSLSLLQVRASLQFGLAIRSKITEIVPKFREIIRVY
jgi:hypothetical protein